MAGTEGSDRRRNAVTRTIALQQSEHPARRTMIDSYVTTDTAKVPCASMTVAFLETYGTLDHLPRPWPRLVLCLTRRHYPFGVDKGSSWREITDRRPGVLPSWRPGVVACPSTCRGPPPARPTIGVEPMLVDPAARHWPLAMRTLITSTAALSLERGVLP